MNTALRERLMQFHGRFQQELVPLVEADVDQKLTPATEQLLRIWGSVGASRVNVRGPAKVMAHLMFGVLVLPADRLLRWVT